jgi:hypothetical protein
MNWKKLLRIAAVTVIPGGLVAVGGWLVVKKLRSRRDAKAKSPSDTTKLSRDQGEKEER